MFFFGGGNGGGGGGQRDVNVTNNLCVGSFACGMKWIHEQFHDSPDYRCRLFHLQLRKQLL